MLALLLALLTQASSPDLEANKLLSGVQGLLQDPLKNADELDRRFLTLQKILDENPAFKRRDEAAAWMVHMGWKTGRAAEALTLAKERLKSMPSNAKTLQGARFDALYSATLAMKSEDVLSIIRAWAKEEPDSQFLRDRERMEKDAAAIGRGAPSVSAPPVEGTKFSWSSATRNKIVILYFTASW